MSTHDPTNGGYALQLAHDLRQSAALTAHWQGAIRSAPQAFNPEKLQRTADGLRSLAADFSRGLSYVRTAPELERLTMELLCQAIGDGAFAGESWRIWRTLLADRPHILLAQYLLIRYAPKKFDNLIPLPLPGKESEMATGVFADLIEAIAKNNDTKSETDCPIETDSGSNRVKKKLMVFVSSTYTDMRDERQAAVEAILRAGHIPAGMELFAAGDKTQLATIRRWINDSDVFALILGGRYGSIEKESGKSYIQLEYEYAIETKKPYFAVVMNRSYLNEKVKVGGVAVMETDNSQLLNTFRDTVSGKICQFFDNIDQLKLAIFQSLATLDHQDLPGWIRSTDAIDAKTTLEGMNRLQAENVTLRDRLKEMDAGVGKDRISLAKSLSPDARTLLSTATNWEESIVFFDTMGEISIRVGEKEFVDPPSLREEARWKAAFKELINHGLVERVGADSNIYKVTMHGYEVNDEIERATNK